MLTQEQKIYFNQIFESLAGELGITKTQYENLVQSYNAVGSWLNDDLTLKAYNVSVYPQGSFRLGTIIQPINEDDDLDIDLVCRLTSKPPHWTQENLKNAVGYRLKSNKTYASMIKEIEGGRRCWTLLYRENNPDEKYHLDVLPSVVDQNSVNMIDAMTNQEYNYENVKKTAIRITDKEEWGYRWNDDSSTWLKSFPDGFAAWFASRCRMNGQSRVLLESVAPVGRYVEQKTILQKSIQILKRHRDVMFDGDDDKPISVIITTLASKAYNGENNLVDALCTVVDRMRLFIQQRFGHDFIENPVNPDENFADKWVENHKKRDNFYKWMNAVQEDIHYILSLVGRERINYALKSKFGERVT